MADEIVAANRAYRNYCLLALMVLALGGAAGLFWGQPALTQYLNAASPRQALRLLRWLLTGLFVPCLIFALYLTLLARRTLRSGRFPPPGMAVIKDSKVQRGADAVKMARLLVVSGALLMVVGLIGGVYFPWIKLQ